MTSTDCALCSRATGGASMQGGTVHLGVATPISDHAWARTEREAAVCPTRVCETAADKADAAELVMLRDLLLCPLAHSLARNIIMFLCDHSDPAAWTAAEIENEAASQIYIITINRYLAHLDSEDKRKAELQEQEQRIAALKQELAERQQAREAESGFRRAVGHALENSKHWSQR